MTTTDLTADLTAMSPLLLRPEEAAEALRLARTRIYELMASGALGSVRIGRSRRIPAACLRQFVDRLTEGAA